MPDIVLKVDHTKPHLQKAMKSDPARAKEVIGTFVEMMEHAFEYGWAELPRKFHPDLTFKGMIHDILHGVLDLKELDPKFYDLLGVAVHPFGLFSYKVPNLNRPEGFNFYDWQRHFDWKDGDLPPIQSILRKLLYYARYIEIDKLGDAMFRKDMDLYLVERDPSPLIAVHPAVKYQKDKLGERFAGKFIDKYGLFDCGPLPEGAKSCPACTTGMLTPLSDVLACMRCGAGFHSTVDNQG
jgi:hypothetical protein